MMRADVSLEIVSVKLVKVCIVWLLIDSYFSINECNVSSRVFLGGGTWWVTLGVLEILTWRNWL